MNAINSITTPLISPGTLAAGGMPKANAADDASGSFKNLLVDSIKNVNSMQQQADQAVEALFTGGDVNPAEVLTAVQKADLAFKLTMQMRNKVMDVYQEIKDIRI
ncbi:MAG: flagellar hook-basal body complex protein FliE [Planctomycetota bacterium]